MRFRPSPIYQTDIRTGSSGMMYEKSLDTFEFNTNFVVLLRVQEVPRSIRGQPPIFFFEKQLFKVEFAEAGRFSVLLRQFRNITSQTAKDEL